MWQCTHSHPLICEARGSRATNNTGQLMLCCWEELQSHCLHDLEIKTFRFETLLELIFLFSRTCTNELQLDCKCRTGLPKTYFNHISASETRPRLNKHTLAKYKNTHKACGLWLIIHLVLLFLVESFNFTTVEQLCI